MNGSSLDADVLSSDLSLGGDVVVSLGVMNDLGLNWDILDSLIDALHWLLNHNGLLNFSSDVLNLSLNGIVVGDGSLNGHSHAADDFFVFNDFSLNGNLVDLLNLLVFNVFLLEGDVLNSALYWDLSSNCFVGSSGGANGSNGVNSALSSISSVVCGS